MIESMRSKFFDCGTRQLISFEVENSRAKTPTEFACASSTLSNEALIRETPTLNNDVWEDFLFPWIWRTRFWLPLKFQMANRIAFHVQSSLNWHYFEFLEKLWSWFIENSPLSFKGVALFFSWFHRQTALLAAISEKDSNIALLELQSSSKSRKQEIKQCKSEKDKLVNELKLQVRSNMFRLIVAMTSTNECSIQSFHNFLEISCFDSLVCLQIYLSISSIFSWLVD